MRGCQVASCNQEESAWNAKIFIGERIICAKDYDKLWKISSYFSYYYDYFLFSRRENVKTFLFLFKLEYNRNSIFSSSFSYLMKIVGTVPVVQ